MLEALERALDSTRHALDALSNYQTVNDSWIVAWTGGIGGALVVYFGGLAIEALTGTWRQRGFSRLLAAPVEEPSRDREAKSEYSPTTWAPTAPPAPAHPLQGTMFCTGQAPAPIPPRQLGLPPGSLLTPGCVNGGGTKSGEATRKIGSPPPTPPWFRPPPSQSPPPPPPPPSPSPPPPSPPLYSSPPPSASPPSPLLPSPQSSEFIRAKTKTGKTSWDLLLPPPEVRDIDPTMKPN